MSVERRARVERSIYSRACFTPAAARDEGTDWVATLGIKGKGLTPGERETCCQRVRPSVESLSVFGTVPDMVFFVIELHFELCTSLAFDVWRSTMIAYTKVSSRIALPSRIVLLDSVCPCRDASDQDFVHQASAPSADPRALAQAGKLQMYLSAPSAIHTLHVPQVHYSSTVHPNERVWQNGLPLLESSAHLPGRLSVVRTAE